MTRGTPRRYRTAAGTPRRQPRVRRASAGLTPTRAAALLTMLIVAGVAYGLSATSAFGFARLEVEGASLTSDAALRTQIALDQGTNLVGLSTGPIADRIRMLPTVRDVAVSVGLPDQLVVRLTERRPIVIWAVGDRRFAVDGDGLLFADVTTDPSRTTAAIPVVVDEREASGGLAVSAVLDPVILDAATRLGSVTPSDVGSHAAALHVHVTDDHGFTISPGPGGWTAVFGMYTPSQRTPALIPGQVQVLDNLLLTDPEDTLATIILADDRGGTVTLKPTPKPSAGTKP